MLELPFSEDFGTLEVCEERAIVWLLWLGLRFDDMRLVFQIDQSLHAEKGYIRSHRVSFKEISSWPVQSSYYHCCFGLSELSCQA
jgi:hypothetical protein